MSFHDLPLVDFLEKPCDLCHRPMFRKRLRNVFGTYVVISIESEERLHFHHNCWSRLSDNLGDYEVFRLRFLRNLQGRVAVYEYQLGRSFTSFILYSFSLDSLGGQSPAMASPSPTRYDFSAEL